jgi:hypothetical protein
VSAPARRRGTRRSTDCVDAGHVTGEPPGPSSAATSNRSMSCAQLALLAAMRRQSKRPASPTASYSSQEMASFELTTPIGGSREETFDLNPSILRDSRRRSHPSIRRLPLEPPRHRCCKHPPGNERAATEEREPGQPRHDQDSYTRPNAASASAWSPHRLGPQPAQSLEQIPHATESARQASTLHHHPGRGRDSGRAVNIRLCRDPRW